MINRYYRAKLVALSPLKISSGQSEHTESDVLLDGSSKPFIPGTAIAGITRHYLVENASGRSSGLDLDYWYGKTAKNEKDDDIISHITFYDAKILEEGCASKWPVRQRDGVGLNDDKFAKPGAKYDYEVVDRGATFDLRFEVNCENGKQHEAEVLAGYLLDAFESNRLSVGGKTTRGFGLLGLEPGSVCWQEIDLTSNVEDYINFEWDRLSDPYTIEPQHRVSDDSSFYIEKSYRFTVEYFLIIRDYATMEMDERGKFIDAEQLKNAEGKPIIPGTSWAGFFRHHMKKILWRSGYSDTNTNSLLNHVFGFVDTNKSVASKSNSKSKPKTKTKSKISFSESVVKVADDKQLNRTRAAIDRFTAGAGDGQLFTTQASFGGGGVLTIRLQRDLEDLDFILNLLDTVVDDTNEGLAALGGMTSIGGGLLELKPIDPSETDGGGDE